MDNTGSLEHIYNIHDGPLLAVAGLSANNAWLRALNRVLYCGDIVTPRGKLTRELQHRHTHIAMTHPVVTIPLRAMNYQFMAAEAYWILNGDNSVAGIAPYNKHISQFSDNGETFFGAYGPHVVKQLPYVVQTLLRDRDSRQAGMTLWHQNPPATKDVPCTISIFVAIRKTFLHMHVFMRSSDVWLGLPYDVFNFSMLGYLVCGLYNEEVRQNRDTVISPGTLYLTAASQHLYETHFDQAEIICRNSTLILEPRSAPPHLWQSPLLLFNTLRALRDAKRGDALRWWE